MKIDMRECDSCSTQFVGTKNSPPITTNLGALRVAVTVSATNKQMTACDMCPACTLKALRQLIPAEMLSAAKPPRVPEKAKR